MCVLLSQNIQEFTMDSPCNSKKPTKREPKQNQSQSCPPPQKNAYARLLSQHNSSKFSLYLKQHMVDTTPQTEEIMPSTQIKAQSDIQNVTFKKEDHGPMDFSNSAEFSPPASKSKGEASSLSLYMQKLVTRNGQNDCERKQGVSDGQHRGQRRDTATSYDGDVESGEELHLLKCNQSKKQPKKNQECQDSDALFGPPQTSKKAGATGQEQRTTNSKKKTPKNPEEGTSRQEKLKSGMETQTQRSGKGSKPQQARGNLNKVCYVCCFPFPFNKSCLVTFFFLAPNSPAHKNKEGKGKKKQVFEAYLTLEEVSHGLKRGEFIQVLIWIYKDLFYYGCKKESECTSR